MVAGRTILEKDLLCVTYRGALEGQKRLLQNKGKHLQFIRVSTFNQLQTQMLWIDLYSSLQEFTSILVAGRVILERSGGKDTLLRFIGVDVFRLTTVAQEVGAI